MADAVTSTHGGTAGEARRSAAATAPPRRDLIREVDCVPDATWDAIVGSFDDPHYEQTACFAGGHRKSRDSHLLLRAGDLPVAGARVTILTLPPIRAGLAFLRFGPFWRRRDREPDVNIYRSVMTALVDEYCVRRGHCLTVMPSPNPDFYRLECAVLAESGFKVRRKIADPNRFLVDLSLDEDTQLRSLDQKWRYNLRQAQNNGFDIRLCESADDVAAFQSLHARMVARKNFSDTGPVHLLGELRASLPEALRPRLVLAYHDGQPIAGAAVGIYGDTAYYIFGATADAALPLKAGYALHWWIVCWLCRQDVRWYDLGGEADQQGLRQFKKGLVGKRGVTVVMDGEYDRWTHLSGRVAADLIFTLREARRTIRNWR
jgi:hypothetical protein